MEYVTSADVTRIAFDRSGRGERVILVTGGLDDGGENKPLAAAVPGARRETLAGQGHVADPRALAALLTGFYRA